MNELLTNPAFQSGIAPFLVALIISAVLQRTLGWFWAGFGLIAAFLVNVFFTTGFEMTPLTSTRKIVLLGVVAAMLGFAMDAFGLKRRWLSIIMVTGCVAGVLWLIWPVLLRKESDTMWILGFQASIYAAMMGLGFAILRHKAMRASAATVALGFGAGIAILLSASALLSQFALSVGAAAMAALLLSVVWRQFDVGTIFVFTAAVILTLVGISASVYAQLPMHVLLPLVFIPFAMKVPVPAAWPRWAQASMLMLVAAPFAGVALYLTWKSGGTLPV